MASVESVHVQTVSPGLADVHNIYNYATSNSIQQVSFLIDCSMINKVYFSFLFHINILHLSHLLVKQIS